MASGPSSDEDLDVLSGQSTADQLAAERLADLQRLTAEYANYRKRTEANRETLGERAVGDTVKSLLPVLDDLDRAEKHGDLEEGSAFSTIAAKLRSTAERLGLRRTARRAIRSIRRSTGGDLPAADTPVRTPTTSPTVETACSAPPRAVARSSSCSCSQAPDAHATRSGGTLIPPLPWCAPATDADFIHTDFISTDTGTDRLRKGGAMASQDWFGQGLLQGSWRLQGRHPRGTQEGLPQARAQVPPGLQPGRPGGGGQVQGDQRSALRARGSRAAQGVDQIRAMGSGARFTAPGSAGQGGFDDVFGGMFGGGGTRGYSPQGGNFDDVFGGCSATAAAVSARRAADSAATADRPAAAT